MTARLPGEPVNSEYFISPRFLYNASIASSGAARDNMASRETDSASAESPLFVDADCRGMDGMAETGTVPRSNCTLYDAQLAYYKARFQLAM